MGNKRREHVKCAGDVCEPTLLFLPVLLTRIRHELGRVGDVHTQTSYCYYASSAIKLWPPAGWRVSEEAQHIASRLQLSSTFALDGCVESERADSSIFHMVLYIAVVPVLAARQTRHSHYASCCRVLHVRTTPLAIA
mmetsp:Transcript_16177/g.49128  ORF Transcript_16177/g.49128 Transcript_16177/m.49128 type:complete len:137 (-) Transcript_16177:329-739(-)